MPEKRIGLRFARSDAKKLQRIADELGHTDELRDHASLFHSAAQAAAGPDGLMIVVCNDPMEAVLMAGAFPRFGVNQPAIEELNQA